MNQTGFWRLYLTFVLGYAQDKYYDEADGRVGDAQPLAGVDKAIPHV